MAYYIFYCIIYCIWDSSHISSIIKEICINNYFKQVYLAGFNVCQFAIWTNTSQTSLTRLSPLVANVSIYSKIKKVHSLFFPTFIFTHISTLENYFSMNNIPDEPRYCFEKCIYLFVLFSDETLAVVFSYTSFWKYIELDFVLFSM